MSTESTETATEKSPETDALLGLNADAFRARLEETFRIRVNDETTLEAELVQVRGLKGDTPREDKSPFALLFAGPEDAALEQGIYRFENEEMGTLDLFLVTVGPEPDDRRMRYEVVFT